MTGHATETGPLNRGDLVAAEMGAVRHVRLPHPTERTISRARVYELKLRGEIAERSLRLMGGESLNDYKKNAPVYDHIFPDGEIASCKTHMPTESNPRQHLYAYAHDFRVAIGAISAQSGKYDGMSGPDFAASFLANLERTPEGCRGIPSSELVDYVKANATLRVPFDQVDEIRSYIRERAQVTPSQFGIEPNSSTMDIERITERIKPLPISTSMLVKATQRNLPISL